MNKEVQEAKITDQIYASFGFSVLIAGIAGPLFGIPSAPEAFRFQILGIGVLLIGLSFFLFWFSTKQRRVEVQQDIDTPEESESEHFPNL